MVNKFIFMAKTNRALRKELLYNWLVEIVTALRGPIQFENFEKRIAKLKDLCLSEIIVGVC